MFDFSVPFTTIIVAATVVIAAASLLAVEIRFARALNARTLHGGAVSEGATRMVMRLIGHQRGAAFLHGVRTHRMRFVARWLSWAPSAHVEATTLRLFRAGADVEDRDRWRQWHRVHLPAFIVRAAKHKQARQERILQSVFSGLRAALVTMKRPTQAEHATPVVHPLTFDALWPFGETVEELAVHCRRDLHPLFASEITQTAAKLDDEAVRVVCAWVVNELLERGEDERALGAVIAKELAENGPPCCVEALRILRALYLAVAKNRGHEKAPETALFAALKGTPVEQSAGDAMPEDSPLDARWGEVDNVLVDVIVKKGTTEEEGREIAKATLAACSAMLAEQDDPSSLRAARGLAALRFTFRKVCIAARQNLPPVSFAAFVRHLCKLVMERVANPRVSAFLTIESMEPIRDKAPAVVAAGMAAFITRAAGRLDPGIAVCICEGVEEGREPEAAHERENQYYFVRKDQKWLPGSAPHRKVISEDHGRGEGIERFWRDCGDSADPKRIADLAQWMNLRLELRDV
jgi:hypothetical protein